MTVRLAWSLLAATLGGCSLLIDTDPYVGNGTGDPDGPSAPVVRILPDRPDTAVDLTADIVTPSVDPLGAGAVTYEYRWFVNDGASEISLPTYPNALTDRGERIRVEVTAISADGARRSATASAETTILNSPPVVAYVGLNQYRPVQNEALIAYAAMARDADREAANVRFTWLRNDVAIPGQMSNRLELSAVGAQPGDTIRVVATPRDMEGEGAAVSAGPAIVLADVTRWRQLLPERVLRGASFVAYDPGNRRVLLGSAVNEDFTGVRVWEYALDEDRGRFTQLFPAGPEPRLLGARAIYDAINQRILLFGGQSDIDSGTPGSDVYVLDVGERGAETWSVLAAAGNVPEPRLFPAVAFDEERQQVLLYGGIRFDTSGTTPLDDFWTLSVAPGAEAWQQQSGNRPPVPIVGNAMLVDPSRDRALMFAGGEYTGVGQPTLTSSIYSLDLTDVASGWSLEATPLARTRIFPTVGIDVTNDRALIAYGVAFPTDMPVTEVTALDLDTLANDPLTVTGEQPAFGGSGFFAPDPHATRPRFILWPGRPFIDGFGLFDLYSFDPADAEMTAIHRTGVHLPGALRQAMAAGNFEIFGGKDQRNDVHAELWSYAEGDRWMRSTPAADVVTGRMPGPRYGQVIQSNSPYGSDIHFFGGRTVDDQFADTRTWVLRENQWIEQSESFPGGAREGAMFFPPACGGRRLGVFGGRDPSGVFLSDTRFLDCNGDRNCTWQDPVGPLLRASARAYGTAARLGDESIVVLYGGYGGGAIDDSVWSFYVCGGGDQPWKQETVQGTRPPPRWGHTLSLATDLAPGSPERLLLFGGSTPPASSPQSEVPSNDAFFLVRVSPGPDSTSPGVVRWDAISPAPEDRITPRFHHAASYDTRTSRLLVYGGETRGSALSDLWELRVRR